MEGKTVFAIAQEQRQYKTYTLSTPDNAAILEVVPERGGIITRWQVKGKEILYLDAERFANPDLTVRGGIPILFPICGNLPDNTYNYKGTPYTLKQHGFARNLPWQVTGQNTQNAASITLTLVSNEQTRSLYPFEFRLDFTYILKGDTLSIHQRYTNLASEPMPFSSGFHPYFSVADKDQLQIDIPSTEFLDQRTQAIQPFAGKFDFGQEEIDVAFRALDRQVATVTDPDQATRLTLTYSPVFSTLVFWTIQGKNYYCLEPWTAGRNALNTDDRLIHLDSRATFEATFDLKIDILE
jgi:galactose mutarotase-like enzyme